MLMRRLTIAFPMFVLLSVQCWSQLNSTKSATYVLEPLTVSNAVYPLQAQEQKIQGRVIALMRVSETGDVEDVDVFKVDPVLAQAAKRAIQGWKFKPVTKDGKAISVGAKVTLDFVPGTEDKGVRPAIEPATEFPEYVRVSQGVSQELLLTKVTPVYPAAAKANHVQGAVALVLLVGKDGTVTDVQLQSGPPELASAAMDAVRQWRYRPYQLLGRAVQVQTTVLVNFR